MKMYETMRPDENLSWCKPFISDDGNTAVILCDGVIYSAMIDGDVLDIPNTEVESYIEENGIEIDLDDMRETGCAQCPFRDDCEAMNVEE